MATNARAGDMRMKGHGTVLSTVFASSFASGASSGYLTGVHDIREYTDFATHVTVSAFNGGSIAIRPDFCIDSSGTSPAAGTAVGTLSANGSAFAAVANSPHHYAKFHYVKAAGGTLTASVKLFLKS